MHSRSATVSLALVLLLPVAACGRPDAAVVDAQDVSAPAPQGVPGEPVIRQILAESDDPPGAQGSRLTLVRYTIAPGAELAPHVHPGVQMAAILQGVLSYRVIEGTVVIHRAVGMDGRPAEVEEITGPAETALHPGDAVVEDGTMLHYGANRTEEPVHILAALLTDPAAELAQPVDTAGIH